MALRLVKIDKDSIAAILKSAEVEADLKAIAEEVVPAGYDTVSAVSGKRAKAYVIDPRRDAIKREAKEGTLGRLAKKRI